MKQLPTMKQIRIWCKEKGHRIIHRRLVHRKPGDVLGMFDYSININLGDVMLPSSRFHREHLQLVCAILMDNDNFKWANHKKKIYRSWEE